VVLQGFGGTLTMLDGAPGGGGGGRAVAMQEGDQAGYGAEDAFGGGYDSGYGSGGSAPARGGRGGSGSSGGNKGGFDKNLDEEIPF